MHTRDSSRLDASGSRKEENAGLPNRPALEFKLIGPGLGVARLHQDALQRDSAKPLANSQPIAENNNVGVEEVSIRAVKGAGQAVRFRNVILPALNSKVNLKSGLNMILSGVMRRLTLSGAGFKNKGSSVLRHLLALLIDLAMIAVTLTSVLVPIHYLRSGSIEKAFHSIEGAGGGLLPAFLVAVPVWYVPVIIVAYYAIMKMALGHTLGQGLTFRSRL